jgi:hypothetical protein
MSRRRISDDIEFGSDSFLDIVANIVGILIILIVVAGIKAGAAPISAEHLAEYLRTHVKPAPANVEQAAAPQPATAPSATPPPAAPPPRPEPLVIPPSPKLLQQANALKAEIVSLDSQTQSAAAEIKKASHDEQADAQAIGQLRQTIDTESGELGRDKAQLAQTESQLAAKKTGLLQLEVDVQKAEAVKPPVATLKHKLTPLGREISGKELHFRLLNNRVAFLPLEELIQRLRPQILHNRDSLIRNGIQRGEIGPVAGFHMEYVLEARHLSAMEELHQGMSVAINLASWKLIAEPDLETESAEEATKDRGDFLRRLRDADADTTITFWVYPDSYAIYRQLQEFAHHENFTVAARPLPFGIPIAGSPQGSRSSGQ